MTKMNRAGLIMLSLAAFVAPARAAMLRVIQHRWGFDGRVVPERINPLSLELENFSPQPFRGDLVLYRPVGLTGHLGARLIQHCFLSPGARRWVQFHPYIRQPRESWTVEWGWGAADRQKLQGPTLGPPARAMLHDPSDPLLSGAHFPLLYDSLFPTTVAATDGLHSLLVDHVPRWAPAQKEALLDWLRRGGQLHIVHDHNGRYPTFSGDLAVLNAPLERFRVGAGLVVRHPLPRDQVPEQTLVQKGFPRPKLEESSEAAIYNLEESLFQTLSSMTRPEHNWALIYVTIIAYVILIGPINYLFGRKRRDYRLALLFFVATVAGCAYLLGFIGRRGHGEATAVHAIAHARQLDADHYDVTQWVNAFVIRGATYDITHDAPHNLYSTCQELEAVRGVIRNGKEGFFSVEIPLYSARAFLHRGKLKGHHIELNVARWEGRDRLRELVLDYKAGFPIDPAEMWALHRGVFYPLNIRDSRIWANTQLGTHTGSFFSDVELGLDPYASGRRMSPEDEPREPAPERVFRRLVRPLVARAIGGADKFHYRFTDPPSGSDHVQVFIFAKAPETCHIQGKRFGKGMGYVLYQIDLFRPQNPPGGLKPPGG